MHFNIFCHITVSNKSECHHPTTISVSGQDFQAQLHAKLLQWNTEMSTKELFGCAVCTVIFLSTDYELDLHQKA